MNKEEYYSRMEKIEGKISTDRCSFDEVHNLTIQQNYLKNQYIKTLEQENEKLNHYKLLYQKVKDRNDKALEYVKDKYSCRFMSEDIADELAGILKGNNGELEK